ncbi:MAG TPA: tetratricopeptide repeat protein [Longimicrobium sp.]|nr:tetratricopeptide repeat protein [Longimicrobium sp.]
MNRSEATVEEILGLLPDLDDLEVLRLRLLGAAVRDPEKEWESSRTITTIDKWIVSPEAVEAAVEEAERQVHEYVSTLHAGLSPFFRAFFSGNDADAALHLVSLGEKLEERGRLLGARRCYRSALTVSMKLTEKAPQVLALRRVGRVSLKIGDLHEAASYYERSAELARDSGDLHAEVIAGTGQGNVFLWQGRWNDAERCYLETLALADTAGPGALLLERGHIYNNLANATTRQRRLDEAERWFESAFRVWDTLSSPLDLGICLHNHAQFREAQERRDEAAADYEAALKLPIPEWLRSSIATDFAAWWLAEGHLTQAEEWGRVAEENAVAAGSPYTLGAMYVGRGRIALERGEADGFIFFEKTLEIARGKGYLSLEAETLVDYAALRAQNDGIEEALAYLERACEILRGLGNVAELERAETALEELRAGSGDLSTHPAGESPLAAAGD